MTNATLYRETMTALTPPADWRGRTLAAMCAAEEKKTVRTPWPRLAACAAALVLVCAGGFFAWRQSVRLPPAPVPPTALTMLTISAPNESMGAYGDDMGHLVVRDTEEQTSKNPTLDNTDGITALPVYKNDPPLERERLNPELTLPGATLEEQLARYYEEMAPRGGLTHPTLETSKDYDFYGRPHTWYAWFEDDASKALTDRLLDYSFARLGDEFHVDEFGDRFAYCRLPAWPAAEGVLYPIRTAEEARADFRAGNYLGADQPTNLETVQILHTELVYFTQPYQAYIQPVYKITYTQDYWDVSQVMRRTEDPAAYTSVSFAYVPAVTGEYVETTDAEFQFN